MKTQDKQPLGEHPAGSCSPFSFGATALPSVPVRQGSNPALRLQAEEALRKMIEESQEHIDALSPDSLRTILHELRVHQIELEMQNEELRQAEAELDASRARYFDLYDLAPVGYVTLSEQGLILEANLTAAMLLGVPRTALVRRPISQLIFKDDQDIYYKHRQELFETGQPQECELRILKHDGSTLWAQLSATAAQAPDGKPACRVVLSDITARKLAQAYREMDAEVIQIFLHPGDLQGSIKRTIATLKARTGFDAVGIRLQDGEDFPYFVQEGFSEGFLLTENSLLSRTADGGVCRDQQGNVCLECTCGLVLTGQTDTSNPLFTRGGSCWTNDAASLLGIPSDQDPRHHPRNQCIHHGYASVALIPIRSQGRVTGLIQLNDRRKGRLTLEVVEILEGLAEHIGEAITRKKMEDALESTAARLRLATRAGGVGIWDWDIANTILVWDAQMYHLYGIPHDQFGGAYEAWRAGLHPDDRQRGDEEIQMALGGGKDFDTEFRVVWPNGETHHIRALALVQRNAAGEPLRMIGTNWDITAHILEQDALRTALKRAEAAAEAKTEFLSVMSHELRTPLNGVLGFADLLAGTALDDEQKSFSETISSSGEHLLSIVNDILDFSSIEHGSLAIQVAPLSIAEVVEESDVAIRQAATEKGIDYRVEVACGVPAEITGDARRIRQILINLLGNALKFTQCGAIILRIAPDSENRFLEFSVEDTGIGISPETLGQLFKPFTQANTTTSRPFGGTGLGLAISKRLAEAMNGSRTVASKLGSGSTFTFRLPLKFSSGGMAAVPSHLFIGADGASPSSPDAEPPVRPAAPLLLVVDDDPNSIVLAGKMLQSLGYRTEFAPDGTEAVKAFVSGKFSAILMDMAMPEMDGLEATRQIREIEATAGGHMPIIAFTANVMPGDRDRCLAAGMDDFLAKPFKKDELAAKLAWIARG